MWTVARKSSKEERAHTGEDPSKGQLCQKPFTEAGNVKVDRETPKE